MTTLALITLAALAFWTASVAGQEPIDLDVVSQGGLVRGEWELVVNAVGDVSNVTFRVDEGPEGPMAPSGEGTYTVTVNTTRYADGVHSIIVSADGPDGSHDYAGVGLDIDNTPPTLKVKWDPVRNVTGDLEVEVSIRDVHLEGSSVDLVVTTGQGRVFPVPSTGVPGEFRLVLDTLVLENRTHAMVVAAMDGAGNVNTSEAREFSVRNLPDLAINWLNRFDEVVVRRTYVLTFEVTNRGTIAVDGFALGYYREENLIETVVYNETVEPGEKVSVTMDWTPQLVSSRPLWRAYVDHENVIDELSEVNNEASQAIRVTSSEGSDCGSAMFVLAVLLPSIALTTTRDRSGDRGGR